MDKKAQVSMFIIIGVVILVILGTVVYISTSDRIEPDATAYERPSVRNYVQECLDYTAKAGLVMIGLKGGYLQRPDIFFSTGAYNMSVLYFNSTIMVPEIGDVSDELAQFIDENIMRCTDFTAFPGYMVEPGTPKSLVLFSENRTSIMLDWPISISYDDKIEQVSEFNVDIPFDLLSVLTVAENICNMTSQHPAAVDNLYLLMQNVTSISYSDYGAGNMAYMITDSDNVIMGEPYYFIFAVNTL
jgi:hypothetical protein